MDTNVMLIVTFIIMAIATILTIRVGLSTGNKEENNSNYAANRGRKIRRLLYIYLVVIVAVFVIFIIIMRN